MKTLITIIAGVGLIFSNLAAQTNDTTIAKSALFSRHFKVTESFVGHLQHLLPPKTGESNQELLLRYLKTQKIDFVSPAYLKFDDATRILQVRSTPDVLNQVEDIIEKQK